ncbi:MAG: P-loop NTPase [Gordonibacter sp.]|uniref:AAA family ATPase n=4 Tax=Gordonibacter sp. TaxID=1968902 RepID=UPI002FC91215
MTPFIALCADTESIRRPDLIGLAGESLASQEWLRLFATAEEARRFLRNDHRIVEAWVAGCDDLEPINLAATLKRDRSDLRVCLLAFQGTGSLMSRASAAKIDASLTRLAFAERYADMKRRSIVEAGEVSAGPHAQHATQVGAGGGAFAGHLSAAKEGAFAGASSPSSAPLSRPQGSPMSRAEHPGVAAHHPAFVLPVVSGSGGAGKSTVAALSALFAQGLGYKTLLLDFDLQFGDMREMTGCTEALSVDEAIVAPERLARLAPDGLLPAVLAAPRRLENAEAVVSGAGCLLDDLQGRFDVIVANTGAAWAEHHVLLLERCSKALFLVDQRPSSLRACRHALDLCARCGIATGPFLFAANRCSKGALLSSIDVSCALKGAAAVELRDGGREVEELMGAGQPLDLISAKNDLCTSLEHVLVDILPSCEGRTLRMAQAQARAGKLERRFGRGRRRGRKDETCLC